MNEKDFIARFEAIEKRLDSLEKTPKEDFTSGTNSEIFEEQDGKIFVTQITGESPKEKTKNIVLLSLLGYKQKINELDILSSKLRENVAMHEIPLENFGTWVKELIPQSIFKKGKKGSTKITYRLTTFGEAKAKRLLKGVVKNE